MFISNIFFKTFSFYIKFLSLISLFSLNFHSFCKCNYNCYKNNNKFNNNNIENLDNNENKNLENDKNNEDKDNNDEKIKKDKEQDNNDNKDNNKEKNDDFIFLNCGFTQLYQENGEKINYNCCWMISAILAILNVPEYQKFIKNYNYDGDEKNLHLKIIKDIYEELKNNIGKYDLDFRKYYKNLYEHGLKYYSEIFKKPTESSPTPAGYSLLHYVYLLAKRDNNDYFKIKNNFNFLIQLLFLVNLNVIYKTNINEDIKIKIKKIIHKFIKTYHYPFYKVFNNENQYFYNFNLNVSENPFTIINENYKKNFDHLYYYIFEDNETEKLFNKIYKSYSKLFKKCNNIEDLEKDEKELDKINNFFDNYNFELNSITFGPGHFVTVVKDPKSNKFYNLESQYYGDEFYNKHKGNVSKPGELINFYNTFPENLYLPGTKSSANTYIFTVTKKNK